MIAAYLEMRWTWQIGFKRFCRKKDRWEKSVLIFYDKNLTEFLATHVFQLNFIKLVLHLIDLWNNSRMRIIIFWSCFEVLTIRTCKWWVPTLIFWGYLWKFLIFSSNRPFFTIPAKNLFRFGGFVLMCEFWHHVVKKRVWLVDSSDLRIKLVILSARITTKLV